MAFVKKAGFLTKFAAVRSRSLPVVLCRTVTIKKTPTRDGKLLVLLGDNIKYTGKVFVKDCPFPNKQVVRNETY